VSGGGFVGARHTHRYTDRYTNGTSQAGAVLGFVSAFQAGAQLLAAPSLTEPARPLPKAVQVIQHRLNDHKLTHCPTNGAKWAPPPPAGRGLPWC
jgi:hypothetical protein